MRPSFEEALAGADDPLPKRNKSTTPPPPPSIREDYISLKKEAGNKKRGRGTTERTKSPSSSPSPPPVKSSKPEVEKKKPFTIPKKGGTRGYKKVPRYQDQEEEDNSGVSFEGPAAEFDPEGRVQDNGPTVGAGRGKKGSNKTGVKRSRNRSGNSANNKEQQEKKSRLNLE